MSRTAVNLVVDLVAAALFLSMGATGYVLWFTLPPGTNKALSLWGLTRHQWGSIHAGISFALLATLLLHLGLHWQWVVSVVRKRLRLPSAAQGCHLRSGLATLLVVAAALAVFAWATQTGVREITRPAEVGVCPPDRMGSEGHLAGQEAGPQGTSGREGQTVGMAWKEVYPILERACLSCHGPSKARGNFRVDRREDLLGSSGRAALVVPGDSAASPLIAIVSGQRPELPRPDAHRLPEVEVARLRAWIDAGAVWPESAASK